MTQPESLPFGELLSQFRRRKGLTQHELAKRIGASREAVSLWERGNYRPETDISLYELARVLNLTEQEQQKLFEAYTVTSLQSSFHQPPFERNLYFTGREDLLQILHQHLTAGKYVAITQAISGLGGIGKTQLAAEYAYRYQKSYHDILWTVADSFEMLVTSYVQLATVLQLREREEQDQIKIVEAVKLWLQKHRGWLLILDNINDLSLMSQFVPVSLQGTVLLTTRQQTTQPVAEQATVLDVLSEEEGALFLLKRTKILNFDQPIDTASPQDTIAARAITQTLGGLPLALDQAGAYILETPGSLTQYLQYLKQRQRELLRRRGDVPIDHPQSITATFSLAFEQVQHRNRAAIELLKLCAFLAPGRIAEEVITQGVSPFEPTLQLLADDPLELDGAIRVLHSFSLIRRDPIGHTLSIHRLVQAVLRDGMDEPTRKCWIESAVRAVNAALPPLEHKNWPQWERLLAHALACAEHMEQHRIYLQEASHLLQQTGWYLVEHARYKEAELLLEQAYKISKEEQGIGHLDTARNATTLAALYERQGKYVEAEPFYQSALAIREQQLGSEHPFAAREFNNLANLSFLRIPG